MLDLLKLLSISILCKLLYEYVCIHVVFVKWAILDVKWRVMCTWLFEYIINQYWYLFCDRFDC